mmetsp:Transcript_19343/g.74188  ORF Transcript_19343/g.74188 Transcript_19343/m.74188 type:complete len:246 (+) Transcript_19343:1794-2531(+)
MPSLPNRPNSSAAIATRDTTSAIRASADRTAERRPASRDQSRRRGAQLTSLASGMCGSTPGSEGLIDRAKDMSDSVTTSEASRRMVWPSRWLCSKLIPAAPPDDTITLVALSCQRFTQDPVCEPAASTLEVPCKQVAASSEMVAGWSSSRQTRRMALSMASSEASLPEATSRSLQRAHAVRSSHVSTPMAEPAAAACGRLRASSRMRLKAAAMEATEEARVPQADSTSTANTCPRAITARCLDPE